MMSAPYMEEAFKSDGLAPADKKKSRN
jgi:hypothetical protein